MNPEPTLKQLRYLAALADHGHFGRAADACHVTQSTLSAGLRELERLLGVALVDRTTRSVVFTPLGRETVARARRVLDEVDGLAEAVRAAGEPLSGPLAMGVIPTISPFLLPHVMPGLRRALPELKLFLKEDLTDRLVEEALAGRLDVLLLALPCAHDGLDATVLFEDDFAMACRRDHPLAAAAEVTAADLDAAALLLLQDGHCLRDHALAACGLGDRGERGPFEATSLHTLVQMVDNGMGVTLLPRLAIDGGILEGTGLVVRPLAAPGNARRIGLAWRHGTRRADEFRLLADMLVRLRSGEARACKAADKTAIPSAVQA